ncbi:hypothetical protein V6N12_028869 [Hibiscus sabdariffa]|uniref:Uncharacterized protein n=1 Tax=Hibiscus sabdariffa TaxID=183260 RepID=A0ABR2F726_9ROSI
MVVVMEVSVEGQRCWRWGSAMEKLKFRADRRGRLEGAGVLLHGTWPSNLGLGFRPLRLENESLQWTQN